MNNRIKLRISKLRKMLAAKKLDALLVSSEPNVSYMSGYEGTESFLVITQTDLFFLTDFRYLEQAQCEAKGFKIELRDKYPYSIMVGNLLSRENIRRIGFEAASIPHALYTALLKSLPMRALLPTHNLIESLRIIKDAEEIRHIRQSVAIAAKGIHHLSTVFAPGMSEKEAQARLEYETKLLGSEKPAFDMIIARGSNSSMPHAISQHRNKIEAQDMILVDMGVVYNGFHSDLTRCFFMGKIPNLHRRIYSIVLEAQERGIRRVKPGATCREVDAACRSHIEKKGFGRYFGHGTGHGVGLEIHEAPSVSFRSNEILKPGMVITVEPGIYLPGKFGVRIEDMVLVTKSGCEVLTRNIKKNMRRID